MDREVLIEIGVEELPAAWMPALTRQLAERLGARLTEHRLGAGAPVESFSTPRRLTGRIAKIAERQEDLEETISGPPVSAAFGADGKPTPAALGFAKKQGVRVRGALARDDAEGGVSRLPQAPARQERRRCLARSPGRGAQGPVVPETDALGREAGRRARRVFVRPPDSLAAVFVRRASGPVHDRPYPWRGRAAGARRRIRRH